MADKNYYLSQNVKAEPLFNQWYAWPSLISPATAAMNTAFSHVKIMKSYLMSPAAHAAAIRNPAMRGGPFIDYSGERVDEIKSLLGRTLGEQAHMIEFAEAIRALNELLGSEARGYSIEGFYSRAPEALKGYIELAYDLNNYPAVRLIEPLLYRSRYYDDTRQSVSLSLIRDDERPFAFSSPVLEDDRHLHVRIPFNSEVMRELFRWRDEAKPLGYIRERLGVGNEQADLLGSFLTEGPAKDQSRFEGDGLRMRYFGHACVLLESGGVSLLTDPLISYRYDAEFPRYSYADLPAVIDYVLITHSHSDHLVLESLLQIRHKVRHVVVPRNSGGSLQDPSLRLILENIGFDSVIEIDEMQSINTGGGLVTSLPFLGEHADLNIRSKNAYLVRLAGRSILFAADSSNLDPKLYRHIHNETGDVDTLFLGMECDGAPLSWMYSQIFTRPLDRRSDQLRRLSGSDYERAIGIVNELNPTSVYVYAMGQEPWLGYITAITYTEESKPIVESNRLVEECRRRGITSERLFGHKEIF